MNDKRVDNPFGELAQRGHGSSMQQVESDRAMQEVQAGMVIAKRFPRDRVKAMDRVLQACTNPSLAEQAQYAYPKGDTLVSGPSIRLAEAILQLWENAWCGVVELARHEHESVAEAYAWDLETNTRDARIFTVPHLRHTRKGTYKLEDPREIYELVANQGARRKRAAIQAVIPREVFDSACRQCDVTLAESVEVNQESINSMAKAFQDEFGVTQEQLVKYLGHRLDSMVNAEMLRLRKVYTALRDGFSTVRDYFDMPASADQTGPGQQGTSGADRFRSKVAAARGQSGQATGNGGQQATGEAQGTPGGDQQGEEPRRDHFGVRWDPRIHAATKSQTKEGRWTRKRGISDEFYNQVLAELIEADRGGQGEGASQESTGADESGDRDQAPEGEGEGSGADSDERDPPAGVDPETGETTAPGEDGGPSDGEIVTRIQRYLPTAREAGDMDMLADLEDEARGIRSAEWRDQIQQQLAEARQAVETGAS